MKIFKHIWLVILLSIIISKTASCQDNEDTDYQTIYKDSSYFSVSLGFISDAVFLGRKDSISAPYLFPTITYYNKSGLYAAGSFSYLTKSNESRIDLFLGTVGYSFNIKKLKADLSASKYFFNEDSYNVISQIDADLTLSLTYDFKYL
tara:strand:+ start:10156 stop:10599 length:444 start_codon:yes stop_codon:yes gene_type:complete